MTNNSGTNWFETEEGKEAAGNIYIEILVPRGGVITAVKSETGTDFFIGYPCYNAKVVKSPIGEKQMFKLYKASGSISKTIVVGWLEILAAVLVAGAEFAKTGDFSVPAILIFAQAVIMIYLRFQTVEPLSAG